MSNPALRPEDRQRFVLRAAPPVRAYLIAAVASLLGAGLLVGGLSGWPSATVIIGIALLVLALALVTVATVLTWRFQTMLLVERDTLTLAAGRRRTVFSWHDVKEISVKGARLVVVPVDGSRPAIAYVDPRQVGRPSFQALATVLRERLDASRGYRDL